MKKTAPRISDDSAGFIPTIFESLNQGCEFIIDMFPTIYQRTIHDLKETFTKSELMLLIDLHNGHIKTASHVGQGLTFGISDGIKYDNLAEKWKVDPQEILTKAKALGHFEKACLEIWAVGFWYNSKSIEDGKLDIEAYVK